MNLQGIYLIRNKINNNTYVGQSKNMEVRWEFHRKDLLKGTHHQKHLQSEFIKLSKTTSKTKVFDKYYEFIPYHIVETYDEKVVLELEDKIILEQRSIREGYKQMTNKEITQMLVDMNKQKQIRKTQMDNDIKKYSKLFESDNLILHMCNGIDIIEKDLRTLNSSEKYNGEFLFFKFVEYYRDSLPKNTNEFEMRTTFKDIQEFTHRYADYWFCKEDFVSNFVTNTYRKDYQIALFNKLGKDFIFDKKSFRKENTLIVNIKYDDFQKGIYEYYNKYYTSFIRRN